MNLPPSLLDVLQPCPCCRAEGSLADFEQTRQIDGSPTRLLICRACLALLDLGSYADIDTGDPAAAQAGDYYEVGALSAEEHLASIANAEENILGYLLRRTSLDPQPRVFCEIGTGRGYAALAAARRFKSAYALDFDLRHITAVGNQIGWPANLHIGRALQDVDVKIDVLMGWHALEHIPQPLTFLEDARSRMNPGGYLFFQVPLFRPAYLVKSHYVFYNEAAMRSLMTKAGMNVIEIGFDEVNGFLTVIAQNP